MKLLAEWFPYLVDCAASRRVRPFLVTGALAAGSMLLIPAPATPQNPSDLAGMSLDSLLSIPVHSAARYAQAMSEAPAAVTVVTAEEIAAFGYRSLDQVLARAAGFYISNDRNYSYVGVRGFSRPTDYNNRVLLLLNGHTVNESVYGAAPIGDELGLDLSLLDRVEIVRGPVSALYGTSAMFAVINLITAEPLGSGGVVTGEVGESGLVSGSARIHATPSRDRAYLVSAQIGRADGDDLFYPEYAHDGHDGIARGRDWTRYANTFASARFGDLRVHGRLGNREKAYPTAAWGTAFDHPDARTIDRWGQVAGSYDRDLLPGLLLSLNGTFDYYYYRGWYPLPDDGPMFIDATDARRYSMAVQTAWYVSARNRLVSGVTLAHSPRGDYRGWYDGELGFEGDRRFTSLGLYVQDELHLRPWLTLVAGGRIDTESDTDTRITPRASAIVRPASGTTLKFLFGTAFRSPNFYERWIREDAGGVDDLDAEHIETLELVVEQRVSRSATLRVSVFHDHVRDLIDAFEDTTAVDDFNYANLGRVGTEGIEAEFTVTAGHWLIHGAGVVQSAVDRDTDELLSNAPRRVFRVGANGALPYRLHAAVQARAESGRLTLGGDETASFGLVDLTFSHRPRPNLRIYAGMTNALNASYAYPAGVEHQQDVIVQDGRRVRLRMELDW